MAALILQRSSSLAGIPSSVSARTAASRRMPRLRLTRRGRLVFFGLPVLTLLLALVTGLGIAVTSAEASSDTKPAVTRVTVLPGESLWDIAERTNPGTDPRDVIDEIVSINGLESSVINSGQQLEVPNYAK